MTTWSKHELRKIAEAYQAKYHGSPYLSPMIGARARSTTLMVAPRETAA